MVDGGRGNDTLLGGQGDDQLDGNVGNDKLDGGAGADYLVGGKGDDRMEGGSGFDTYVIDAGDGNDVIVDADGLGEIVFEGKTLTGAGTMKDGKYVSPDSKISYSFAGDLTEGGVLTIATESSSIRVINFKNGALGISLAEGAAGDVSANEPVGISGQAYSRVKRPVTSADNLIGAGQPAIPVDGAGDSPATGESASAPKLASMTSSAAHRQSAPGMDGGAYADLFVDPLVTLPLVTGENVNQAISTHYSITPKASSKIASHGLPVAGNVTFLEPGSLTNEGISARHIEYALMDFHDAINIGTG